MFGFRHICFLAAACLATAHPAHAANARAIHERLLTLDTHLDTPMNFARPGWDMMDQHSVQSDMSQVDYPRMVQGGLDGGFFAIFIPQGPRTPDGYSAALNAALKREGEIRDMV